jgi:hypothetical protein
MATDAEKDARRWTHINAEDAEALIQYSKTMSAGAINKFVKEHGVGFRILDDSIRQGSYYALGGGLLGKPSSSALRSPRLSAELESGVKVVTEVQAKELPPVVIGENMERVVRVARNESASFFRVIPELRRAGDAASLMRENRRWIERRIAEGRTIIDLGEDATRPFRSSFYEMEKNAVREAIENLKKVP